MRAINRIGAVTALTTATDTTDDTAWTISIEDAAARLGISPNTCRRWIKADMADGGRRVPGGRCEGTKYVVIRAVFERAMRHGIEPEPRPVAQGPDMIAVLEAVLSQLRQSA